MMGLLETQVRTVASFPYLPCSRCVVIVLSRADGSRRRLWSVGRRRRKLEGIGSFMGRGEKETVLIREGLRFISR